MFFFLFSQTSLVPFCTANNQYNLWCGGIEHSVWELAAKGQVWDKVLNPYHFKQTDLGNGILICQMIPSPTRLFVTGSC